MISCLPLLDHHSQYCSSTDSVHEEAIMKPSPNNNMPSTDFSLTCVCVCDSVSHESMTLSAQQDAGSNSKYVGDNQMATTYYEVACKSLPCWCRLYANANFQVSQKSI